MTIETLKERIIAATSSRAADTLEELENYVGSTFKDDAALLKAIKDKSDELNDIIHEIADGRVSVYTRDRMEWLTENIGRADQENAIACGAKNAEDIAAYCWYECETEDIREDLSDIRDILNDEDDEA